MDAATGTSDREVARRLVDAVDRSEKLPVLDKALQRVLALADQEEAGLTDLVDALEQDPGLAANILRFANSAANPVRMPIGTVRQAVTMVGRNGVRRLALDAAAYRFFERAGGNGGASRGQMHLHAVQVSRLAVICAGYAGIGADAAHLAGLLHDCGKLVLPLAFGEGELDEIAAEHSSGVARAIAERERLGADHAQAGALFAAASGVDAEIIRAIAWHHGGDDHCSSPDRITACVQLADQVAGAVGGGTLDAVLCSAALMALGLPDDVLDDLADAITGGTETGEPGLAEQVRALEAVTRTDSLTGLASRAHWLETVGAALAGGHVGGIVLVDIDQLAAINQTHGRQVGDAVLCRVASLAGSLGFAGRLGDDDLAIWIADEPSLADDLGEQIVRAARHGLDACAAAPLTVSSGSASTMGGDALETVLAHARYALACAKRDGRDRAVNGDVRIATA